jgi:predicted amidohydrolase YtcJ
MGDRTRVIDLRGGMLLPGFHDSHVHPVTGGVAHLGCQLSDDTTRAAVVEHIARCARDHPDAAWVRGSGWQLPVFPDANPSRALLDSLVPNRPAFFESADGHSAWVNSRALAAAGITAGHASLWPGTTPEGEAP